MGRGAKSSSFLYEKDNLYQKWVLRGRNNGVMIKRKEEVNA